MKTALRLARKGSGRVSPNPMVGAVLVKNGAIVGKGYHRDFGGPHAEVNAIADAGRSAGGADLFINLEPCCHTGKTPPCVDRIIANNISRVFIGMVDPNPAVRGKSINKLKKNGIAVETGILEETCKQLNESFIKYITENMPFTVMKAAVSIDGRLATRTGDSRWISGEASRKRAHRLRAAVDAVMVGAGTVLADDPELTVRMGVSAKRLPSRIVVDDALRVSAKHRLMRGGAPVIIATAQNLEHSKKAEALRSSGAQIVGIPCRKNKLDLTALFKKLARLGIASVLIEGGAELHASALECGLVDKIMVFYAPKIIGGTKAIPMVAGRGAETIREALFVSDLTMKRIGDDFLLQGYIRRPSAVTGGN
jgi:diaminohydroxyphosphoribosylaminopyrimidine deaminase/5-amino-6-(5-phosphoribosylamino)uracil reductase